MSLVNFLGTWGDFGEREVILGNPGDFKATLGDFRSILEDD